MNKRIRKDSFSQYSKSEDSCSAIFPTRSDRPCYPLLSRFMTLALNCDRRIPRAVARGAPPVCAPKGSGEQRARRRAPAGGAKSVRDIPPRAARPRPRGGGGAGEFGGSASTAGVSSGECTVVSQTVPGIDLTQSQGH